MLVAQNTYFKYSYFYFSSCYIINVVSLSYGYLGIWFLTKLRNDLASSIVSDTQLVFWFPVFFLFCPCHRACGILAPNKGWNACPPQWKRRLLTNGPPGNFHNRCLLLFSHEVLSNSLCPTEWSKSDREGEISYDIPYMWNLKRNNTNEHTK